MQKEIILLKQFIPEMQVLKGKGEEKALKLTKQLNGKKLACTKYLSKHSTSVPRTGRR